MRKTIMLVLAGFSLALGLAACGGVAGEGDDVGPDVADDGAGGDVDTDAPLDETVPDEAAADEGGGADGDEGGGADGDLDADAAEADGNLSDADGGDGEGGPGETVEVVPDVVPSDGDGGPPVCGNGIPEPPDEECDDGNEGNGDGCDTDCTFSCHIGVPAECPEEDENPCTTRTCAAAFVGYICITVLNTDPCADGDPCTVEDRCSGGTCVGEALPDWYADEDDDDFGDLATTTCASEAPAGYVDNADDCCDGNSNVNPAQTGFFPEGYSCGPLPVVLWDYNCDDRAEPRWLNCLICSLAASGLACDVTPGWLPSSDGACVPPACGVIGAWAEGPLSCMLDGTTSGCVPTMAHSARRQECR